MARHPGEYSSSLLQTVCVIAWVNAKSDAPSDHPSNLRLRFWFRSKPQAVNESRFGRAQPAISHNVSDRGEVVFSINKIRLEFFRGRFIGSSFDSKHCLFQRFNSHRHFLEIDFQAAWITSICGHFVTLPCDCA